MSVTWTQQSVLALAPDPESAKAGKGLATKAKWVTLACREATVWGECQGSGSKPYQTRIDLSEPAFKCSCPSRKFPCKHSLGLFLLYAEQQGLFAEGEPPGWVSEWLESRNQRAQKQAEKREKAAAAPVDPAAQAKRQAGRLAKVTAGLDDLERWLRDLVRGGLAAAQTQPYSFWDQPASRLVDAQAPGLARMVRDLAGIPASGPGWPERLLARLGKIQLLVDAFRHRDGLPEDVQADVGSLVGLPVAREDVLRQPLVRDRWMAVAQTTEEDPDGMRVQRLWMWGRETGRCALLLTFTHWSQLQRSGGNPEAVEAAPGTELTADLAFYPGAVPLRALMAEKRSGADELSEWPRCGGVDDALKEWSAALARKPWIEEHPVILRAVVPVLRGEVWMMRDEENRVLPVGRRFSRRWELMAASGGSPVGLFGLWNGEELLPLGAWANGRWINLAPPREAA